MNLTWSTAFCRRCHHWIGFPGAIFLLFAAVTAILVACTELFGEEEALREATRDLVGPMTARAAADAWSSAIARASATVAAHAGDVPVDKVILEFRGSRPRVTVFTRKRTGGEAFGDGRLVMEVLWGSTLVLLTISGLVIYFRMRPRAPSDVERVFW
jgi:uncharacterized iron-regulated membrane protein